MNTHLALRLSQKEWIRVLEEARLVAAGADQRLSNPEVTEFIKDRIEIHLGYILMMRPLRSSPDPLVPMPDRVMEGLAAIIGKDCLETLWELDGWHR